MRDRETIAVYILLANALIRCNPYDARGGLVLLQSMESVFDLSRLTAVNTALHFNALAGLEGNEITYKDAAWSMTRVVVHLERLLAQPERAA